MNERLSRKDIKRDIREDQLQETMGGIFAWVLAHTRLLAAAAIGLVLVVVLAFVFRSWLAQRADAAGQLLDRAITVYEAPVVPAGAVPDDPEAPTFADAAARRSQARELFEEILADYSRHGEAAVAAVYLGEIAREEGDARRARELWRGFLEEHRDHILGASVRVSLLRLDRESGQGEQVVEELRQILDGEEQPLPVDLALFELGRTLEELGREEEARETYQRLGDEYPDSPFAPQARTRMQALTGAGAPS